MTALAQDRDTRRKDGVQLDLEVAASQTIYGGAFVCVNAAGYALEGSDTSGLIFQGVAKARVDNSSGSNGDKSVVVQRRGLHLAILDTAITIANVGDNVFLVDDQTVDVVANVSNNIYCGVIAQYVTTTLAYIDIEPAVRAADVATHIADTTGAHAATAISYADDDGHTSETDVDGALDEIYQNILTAQAVAPVNLLGATELDGTLLAAFADGTSTTPGIDTLGNEAIGIRWNNDANPDPIITNVVIPTDLDASADVVVHVLAAKTGATVGDATTFDVGAFFLNDATLYDADADAGGTTSAMTGDATAKTLQEETVTIASADVAAAPGVISLTLQPTDGTLGTDDVIVVGMWLEYTRKALTA